MSHNYNFQRTADLALKLQEATARVADVESYVLAQVSTGHSRAIVPTARTDVDQMGGLDELIYDVAALLKSTTKSLTRTLRAVARRRNEFVNINSLPEEILRPIFLHASGDNMYHKFSIADTCVPWRNICIAFPGFWTDFEVPHAYDVASRAFTIAEQAGLPLRLKIDWNATPYKVIQLVDARGKLIDGHPGTNSIRSPLHSRCCADFT
ncbi:hypothetical protein K466DRAFT_171937 [Polyporus arcularius HHB13444]|uniref:F-box domain-containing protein n=1 Tax=Polyporus arcularius HHB13444 TaxID=1314778 RepID=A0A5C3PAI9_9APHY|nr:hypothetical protein K466DRAFT_171937 [Polyporus arcularius HHB13444]